MAIGLQKIPLRIPSEWDAKWFVDFCRDVLALADVRNALGDGIDISGQPGEVATLAVSADIQNLLQQTFVLAQPSGFLENERTLAGEADVIQILDGGPDANITVALIDGGLPLGKLKALTDYGVLGNPVDGGGAVQNLVPSGDKAVLHVNGTAIEFDLIDSTYVSDFDEAAQDAVGGILNDSPSIDLTYNDALGVITADVDVTWAAVWEATHRWTDNDEVQLGTGGDLRLFHDGTDSYLVSSTGRLQLTVDGGGLSNVRIHAVTNARALDINSNHASGPYVTFLRSGTAFADFGDAAQLFSGGSLDGVGFVTRGTQPLEFGTSSTRRWMGLDSGNWKIVNGALAIVDGMAEPTTDTGFALIFVDTADGDLKIKFGDGTVKLIVTD